MQKQPKIKLKTLPNELNVEHEHHVFQSQSDEHYIKTIDLSSPTFATNDLRSQDGDQEKTHRLDEVNKQNRISLSLRELKNKGNVPELRNINDLQSCFQSNKKNDIAFLKAQNQYLVQKCKELDGVNKQNEEQMRVLNEKLAVCKKSLQDKYFAKVAKFLQMPNSSKDQSNVDIYLEMQAYKQDYKKCRENYLPLENQNSELKEKIQELEGIITNYTEKSDKKKVEKLQNSERMKEVQKHYQEKLEEAKRKLKEYQNQGKEKQKQAKKIKDDYERLKFLKEEIQKKRQQDIKIREQLENSVKQKENLCYSMKEQLLKSQQQCQHLSNKLSAFNKSSQNIEQELMKSHEELSQLHLSVVTLQTQNSRLKHNIQNHKLINQKYSLELTQLRKQNQGFYDQVESLKIEKDRLESVISKHASSDERQLKRIAELENKYNQTEKQLEEVKIQFQQQMIKNTGRNYPEVSKFKEDEQISEKLSSQRGQESLKNSVVQEKIKNIEEKYNKIVQELNKQIQQLRKCKQNLEIDLDSERQRNQKMNIQLQNTYRKIEEFGYTDFQGGREIKQKDRFKRGEFYGTSVGLPFQLTRTTKATPQLRMIKQILSTILGTREAQKLSNKMLGGFRDKEKDSGASVQFLIEDIKRLAQEMADLFDDRSKQIQMLVNRIQSKEEVISKLLRFTPEQKKICILDYLKVMESMDEYTVQHVYKVTKNLQEEASEWKRYINSLLQAVEKNQQELMQLRRQIGKYRSEGGGVRKYQLGYGEGIGKRQRIEKIDKVDRERDRDRVQKYEKYQYRRY